MDSSRWIMVVLVAFLFTYVGSVLPDLYYRYVDKTVYISVKQPFSLNKKIFTPCEEVKALIVRTSIIDTQVEGLLELTLVKPASLYIPIPLYQGPFVVNKGTRTLEYTYKLPCTLPDGEYLIRGIYKYEIKDYHREYALISEYFTVQSTIDMQE